LAEKSAAKQAGAVDRGRTGLIFAGNRANPHRALLSKEIHLTSFELVEPHSFEDAFAQLDSDDPAVRPFGGGTALMLMMKAQIFKPVRLVSLRNLGLEFHQVETIGGERIMRVGAMTTFSALEHSEIVKTNFPILAETMVTLANVRVRNVATVGGNLAHGDPHLDLPPVWTALDARARIVGRGGERVIPVQSIFAGYYETTLAPGELIRELEVPIKPGMRARYTKVTTRAEHDWPAIGIAVAAQFEQGVVKDVRVVLSAAVDRPTRLTGAEAVLMGERASDALFARAGEAAAAEADVESDSRGSAAYKKELLRVHLARTLTAIAGE
jgi:carbon-monoxide dehydrogenase medium subunit